MEFLYKLILAPWVNMLTDPLFFGEVVIGGVLAGVMYALVALGFVLIYKASGVFNFAQGVMVLFAALSLVGIGEILGRFGVSDAATRNIIAVLPTIIIMLALAFVIERVILRHMVNQEQIILFMATIGLTFFLEGFGETVWGSDVKKLEIGIPDARLDLSRFAVQNWLVQALFVLAVLGSIALLFAWRVRSVRGDFDSGKDAIHKPVIGPRALLFGALGVVCFLARFFVGPEAAFIGGKTQTTATLFSSLSWFGLGLMTAVAALVVADWRGRRLAIEDQGADVVPLHYGWFVALGVLGAIAVAAGIVWAVRGGIQINGFELFAAAMAATLVIVLAIFFQKTRVGRALRAVADDHAAALSVGISLRGIWVIVWAVAGIVALAAGIIWGGKSGVQFSLSLIALKALPVLILGGFTSVPGAIVGGLIIGVGEKLAEVYWGQAIGIDAIENWFAYVMALVFLLFRPQGLFGEKIIERV
jgi:branched-subunit amino acid ABC-type transport system permease component